MEPNEFSSKGPAIPDTHRIASALERISTAFRSLLWAQGKALSLNPIQVQVLAYLSQQPAERRRLSAIAQTFGLSRASVSDTMKTLSLRGLVRKEPDPLDFRSSVLHLTADGEDAANRTAQYAQKLWEAIDGLQEKDKRDLYWILNQLIRDLHGSGVITIQRMCLSCQHYQATEEGQGHFCHLLNEELQVADLRMDCPEHMPRDTR